MATTNVSKRQGKGRVIFPRRNYLAVTAPKDRLRPRDPIAESVGALADFPLWDAYLAIIEENRQEQNHFEAGED